MDERIVTNKELKEDTFDFDIRPNRLDEYIGQSDVKENIDIYSSRSAWHIYMETCK